MIITDGMENASKEYNRRQVADMISLQQDIYKWNFVFLGANIDSFSVASSLGIKSGSTMSFAFNPIGVASSTASLSMYTSALKSGANNVAFTDEDYKIQNTAGSAVVNPTTSSGVVTI